MLQGLDMSASRICLLLISCAAAFPANKEDYKYPYLTTLASSGEASPRSGALFNSESSRPPLPSLQHEPSAIQQPGAALQHPGSPAGVQSPSGPSAPSGAPSHFVFPASSSSRPSRAPQSSGHISPPVSFSGPSQPGVGSSNVGVNLAAVSWAAPTRFVQPVRQGTPVRYQAPVRQGAPVRYEAPVRQGTPVSYEAPVRQGAPVNFVAAPSSFSFEGPSSAPLSWPEQFAGFDGSFAPSSWIPSRSFPDFSVWDSEEAGYAAGVGGGKGVKGVQHEEVVEEIAPQASSSYITQSRNGYLRARELVSHMSYVPEDPEAPVIYYELVQKTQQAAPQAPVKGGKKF